MTTKYVKIYQLSSNDDPYNYETLTRICGSNSYEYNNKLFEKDGQIYYSNDKGDVNCLYDTRLKSVSDAGNNSGISEQLLCAAIAAVSGKILK